MKAAIMKNGEVIGEIRGLTEKWRSIDICGSFTRINRIEDSAKNLYKGKPFQELEDASTEAKTSFVYESPVNIKTYKLSYSAKNLAIAEKIDCCAIKVKCLDYPDGFYIL